MGKGREENGGKDTGNKKHKWQVQNRQGEVKNSIGNSRSQRTYVYDPKMSLGFGLFPLPPLLLLWFKPPPPLASIIATAS